MSGKFFTVCCTPANTVSSVFTLSPPCAALIVRPLSAAELLQGLRLTRVCRPCCAQAGHALIGALMPEYDPVQKISIVPRGAAGGLTFFAPSEERLESGLYRRVSPFTRTQQVQWGVRGCEGGM